MAGLKIHPEDPAVRARVDAFYRQQGDQRAAATLASTRALIEVVRRYPLLMPVCVVGIASILMGCTRSVSSGVIPGAEGSPTLDPTDTPTGTVEHTATNTAILAITPPLATEAFVVLPTASQTEWFVDNDGDGVPDFPDIDPEDDGVDPTEMVAGVATVSEWVNDSLRALAEGKEVSPMVEKLAHLFGFDQEGLRAKLAAAPDQPLIDLPWMADTDVGRTDVTTAAEHLFSRGSFGILTTGEGLDNMLKTLAPHIRIAGQLLDDPDSAAMSLDDLRLSLANSLGVDSESRAGIQPSPLGELGRNGDLCLNVVFGEGNEQNRPSLNIPVVVDAGVSPGAESMDSSQKIHVSTESAIGLAFQVVANSELSSLMRFLQDEGDVAAVTKISPNFSLLTEAFLVEENPDLEGSQFVSCGRPAQGGVRPAATPTPSATPIETPRPQGDPGPGPDQPSPTRIPPPTIETPSPGSTNTPVPSATLRPTETPVPPTNTPSVPTGTPVPPNTPDAGWTLTPIPTGPEQTPVGDTPTPYPTPGEGTGTNTPSAP